MHASLGTLAFGTSTEKVRTIRIIGGKQTRESPRARFSMVIEARATTEEEAVTLILLDWPFPLAPDIKRGRVCVRLLLVSHAYWWPVWPLTLSFLVRTRRAGR